MNKSYPVSALIPPIVAKITKIRQFLQSFGYSQQQIQTYFLTALFHYCIQDPNSTQQILISKIMAISSSSEAEQLLSVLDMQATRIENLEKLQKQEAKIYYKQPFTSLNSLKEKKKRREKKAGKNDGKRKRQRNQRKENENQENEGVYKTPEQLKKTNKNVCTGIFGLANVDTNSMKIVDNKSFGNPFANDNNLKQYRDSRERQKIAQKLMQIQILSQLMSAESSQEKEEQLRLMEALISNPFMTRV